MKQMIAEKPNTDFDGSTFNASGADVNPKVPKRSASGSSAKAVPVKKIRDQNGMDASRSDASSAIGLTEVQSSTNDYLQAMKLRSDKASHGIAQELRNYNQIVCDNAKKIGQLQTDLDEVKNKTRDLEQKNATITEEKKELERMVDGLKEENKRLVDEKKKSEEKYAALLSAKNEEKKALEQKNEELECYRNQIYQMSKPPK